ncbi:hypothetical protein ACFWYW_53505 [Nonomuraea sp. NPDC059023]|uniref:hypothetical protein n=1 Tax=unclassified Nonomuraea TaxID=2593643 RepID=UPI0036914C38
MRTTRRELLAGALALATLPALSACAGTQAEPAAARPASPPPTRPVGLAGTLYARTASGLVAVDLATGKQIREYGEAVPDAGWKRLHQLKDGRLRVLDLPSGKVRRETPVSGAQVKAVSRSGELVAAGSTPSATPPCGDNRPLPARIGQRGRPHLGVAAGGSGLLHHATREPAQS